MLKDKMFQCVCHSVAQSGDTKYFLGWNKYETQIFNKFQLWKFSDLMLTKTYDLKLINIWIEWEYVPL